MFVTLACALAMTLAILGKFRQVALNKEGRILIGYRRLDAIKDNQLQKRDGKKGVDEYGSVFSERKTGT